MADREDGSPAAGRNAGSRFDAERAGDTTEHRVVRLADLEDVAAAAPVVSLHEIGGTGAQADVVDLRAWRRDPVRAGRDRPDAESGGKLGRKPGGEGGRPVAERPRASPPGDGSGGDAGGDGRRRADRRRPASRPGAGPARLADPGGRASGSGSADETTDDAVGPRADRTSDGRREPGGRPRGGATGSAALRAKIDADPIAAAREICLRLLADRAHTRGELAAALLKRGVPDDAAEAVLERFDEVGLIDDAAFAGQWVRSRHGHRGLARRAIAVELRRKGVADEVAQDALAEVDPASEERRARELVDRKLRTMAANTTEQRVVAARRLVGMLARRGYPGGIAYSVVRAALAAHGAGDDEFDPAPEG